MRWTDAEQRRRTFPSLIKVTAFGTCCGWTVYLTINHSSVFLTGDCAYIVMFPYVDGTAMSSTSSSCPIVSLGLINGVSLPPERLERPRCQSGSHEDPIYWYVWAAFVRESQAHLRLIICAAEAMCVGIEQHMVLPDLLSVRSPAAFISGLPTLSGLRVHTIHCTLPRGMCSIVYPDAYGCRGPALHKHATSVRLGS
ncbi:hypothetical protein FKP32DRAFT_611948 [Trametes sanguinea]|nr:hypothetical protein FKP32DRAFT_611948 [Trametes sanguinea]